MTEKNAHTAKEEEPAKFKWAENQVARVSSKTLMN